MGGNRLSVSLAFFVLFLALMTWLFDRYFKSEAADCQAFCAMQQGHEGVYQAPVAGHGRRKRMDAGKCECVESIDE